MKELKDVLESHGYEKVRTYINSGNVIFESAKTKEDIKEEIEHLMEKSLHVQSKVIILSKNEYLSIVNEVPATYENDKDFKADVLFFMDGAKELAIQLKFKDGLETYKILDKALIYGISRKNATKSSIIKIVGTPFYHLVTIRNVNTVRKLKELLND